MRSYLLLLCLLTTTLLMCTQSFAQPDPNSWNSSYGPQQQQPQQQQPRSVSCNYDQAGNWVCNER